MKLVLVLTIVCLAAGLLMGVTYNLTAEKIRMQEANKEKESLKYVIPSAVEFSEKINGRAMEYYKGFNTDKNLIGYAFIGEGKGYSNIIRIMIGIDLNGAIQGIKILSQQETPGLGSRVEEIKSSGTIWDKLKGKKIEQPKGPWFQEQFRSKLADKVNVITGATITSNAVVGIVESTIGKFKREELG